MDELDERLNNIRLSVATCSVTIIRYLSDNAGKLPVGIMTRLLQTRDTIMALVPLADSPPWKRERGGVPEHFEGGQWTVTPPAERFRLSNTDAQVHLSLIHI